MQTLLTIVVTCYQDAENLRLTLDSLASQSVAPDPRVEVIISDGGSTDGSAEVWLEHSQSLSSIRSEPDSGVYDGMNLGAIRATGTWLQFLNAGDALADTTSLEVILAWLEACPDDSIWAICGARNRGTGVHSASRIKSVPHLWWRHAFGLQPHCHQATFFRKTMFAGFGGHDLGRGFVADHDLIMRFGIVGRPFVLDRVLVDYQGGGMSEKRAGDVPRLLHLNRVERLNLYGPARELDRMAGLAFGLANRVRIFLGRVTRRLVLPPGDG